MPNFNTALPGFSGLSTKLQQRIDDMLSGRLSGGTQRTIQDAAATQAVAGGMPGTSRTSGSLYGNRTLRDLGLTAEKEQQQGIGDLLSTLQAYSGTVVPTTGQEQQDRQFNQTLDFNRNENAQNRMQRLLEERMQLPDPNAIAKKKFGRTPSVLAGREGGGFIPMTPM